MFKNYFKTSFRNLWRNKTYSIIKILGLGIGLTVCMLIFLYTKDELSYDKFHANRARIYRIIQTWKMGKDPAQSMGITNAIMGETYGKEIPEVQQYVRLNREAVTINKGNDVFTENPLYVDENFFTVFSFPLRAGGRRTALKDLHSVVLSENLAKKYFDTDDVIGETMRIKLRDEFENFTVTAVAENSPDER